MTPSQEVTNVSSFISCFPQLLQKEKEKRLGCQKDFMEIKTHEFFNPVNWDELDEKKVKPPYNPNVVSGDILSFDILYTRYLMFSCNFVS